MRDFLLSSTALSSPEDEGGSGGSGLEVIPQVGAKPSASVTIGADNKMKAERPSQEGISANFGANGEVTTRRVSEAEDAEGDDTDDAAEGPEEDKDDEPPEGDDKDDSEKAEGDDPPADLPEFNPEDEAVLEQYDARFYSEKDGKPVLNITELGDEVYRNSQKEGGAPALNEGTYAYLESRLGVTKEMADDYIAGQIAKKSVAENAFFEKVGGKENWESQVEWGKANYTPAQKKRFNEVMAAKNPDPEAVQEQIDLLNARAVKGGWKGKGVSREGAEPETKKGLLGAPRAKRRASPEKSATAAEVRTPGGLKGFANNDEYVAAMKAAGTDPAKVADVRKNLAASSFWRPSRKG